MFKFVKKYLMILSTMPNNDIYAHLSKLFIQFVIKFLQKEIAKSLSLLLSKSAPYKEICEITVLIM